MDDSRSSDDATVPPRRSIASVEKNAAPGGGQWNDTLVPLSEPSIALPTVDEIAAIYDTAPVGLCLLDRELRFVRINRRLAEMNGPSIEEHLGKTVREVIPQVADKVEPILRQVLQTGMPVRHLELVGETPAQPGVERTWIEQWFPFKNKQGEITGINIVTEEVTELRQAEKLLQESEQRYRALFNSIDDGFCVCEILLDEHQVPYDYRFLEVNHTFENHTGLKDATGKTAHQLVPNLESYWVKTYAKVALEGQHIRFEQGSDAMGRWFDVYAFPFSASGPHHFAVQFKNISVQKQAEEALRQSEARFRGFADTAPALLWVTDPDGQCTYLSQAWYAYTGQPAGTGLGFGWLEAVHPDDRAATRTMFSQANEQRAAFQHDYRLCHHRNGYRWAIDAGAPYFDDEGTFLGYVGSVTDIHDRKVAEEAWLQAKNLLSMANQELTASNQELAATNQQLLRVNADLDNFVYTASHDLKAPITNIQGLLALLRTSLPPENLASPHTQNILDMMETSVNRFTSTIADLSDITRLQKQADSPAELLSLQETIEDVRMDIAPSIHETRAQFDIDVNTCGPIRFSPKNLRSVVYNLLSNAIKYRHPDRAPVVRIRCTVIDDFQVLTVADNGLGMDLHNDHRLFSMFQRFHDHVEGTGIGLYIVKKIVDNSGGKIEVESQVGEGTTFRIFFKR